ncbi:DNA repair-scaffolding protein-like [Babylonia areolata]|uniref:DNA repair-scaffolding protein-like n=1 Tax=Babylonia areolata TaxID=304850 RepID=UPI003FD2E1FD
MWQHQHKADAISQGAGSKRVSVKVTSLETVYGLQLAKCTIVGNPSSLQHSANAQCFVLFQSLSSKHKAVLQQGATVHICPPWQQVDTSAGRTLLCTRYHVSHCTSEQSQDREMCGDDRAVSLSSSPVLGHGSWMCPCSADSSIPAARCPAHLFPFLPSSITQTSPATQHSKQSRAGRTLHTVTSTERAPKVTFTLNTLLESIEKAPAGDRLLPTFQATVLRVFREQQEAGSLRYSLLMEDSQGTVAVVSGVGQVCDVEGRLCGFSCLRVHSRTNPDRDPALFSVVGEVWSHTARAAVASQDSGRVTHSDDSQVSLQSVAQPPGFCYLLEVDRGACSVLEGGEWLTMPPTHPSTLPPPLPLTPLSQALQNKRQSSRLCILCKFLHFSEKKKSPRQVPDRTADHHSGLQNTWILSLTDHSLQRGHPSVSDSSPQNQGEKATSFQAEDKDDDEDSKLPAFVRVEVRQDCCTSGIGWECGKFQKKQPVMVLLRDVWFVNGSWIADKYCSLTSTEIDSAEAVVLRGRVDSDVYRAVSQCTVSFPAVCASSQAHSLVSVSGRIQSVDEKSAFSWEECDGCGSDQLAVRTGLQSLTCLSCGKSVSSPVQRMKMDITVLSSADPSVSVTISLQQSTIQELLPDEEEEEGYDVDCVLNKELGPVNCFITSTTGTAITAVQLSC